MLLVVDIGNTNITMGVFGGHNLNAKFRITTKIIRTSDEYGLIISAAEAFNAYSSTSDK